MIDHGHDDSAIHSEVRQFIQALDKAFDAPEGSKHTLRIAQVDGMPAIASVRHLPGGIVVRATRLLGHERVQVRRSDAEIDDALQHYDRAGDVRATLYLEDDHAVGLDVDGSCASLGLLYAAVARRAVVDADKRTRFVARARLDPEENERDRLDPLVCECRGLRRSELIARVYEGADGVEGLAARTGAGESCGGCIGRLGIVVEDARRMMTPKPSPAASDARRIRIVDELDECEAEIARRLPEPPVIKKGIQRVPVLGVPSRLKAVITDPIGMVLEARAEHGPAVSFDLPTKFRLSYVDDDLMDEILTLPADVAAMGPVFGNIPTVGFWFPRHSQGADALQALALCGRRAIADLLAWGEKERGDIIRETTHEHIRGWAGEVDLLEVAGRLFSDASARAVLGRAFWDRVRGEALGLYRDIAEGIDIPRATLAVTPFKYGMPEYKATKKLHRLICDVIAEHDTSGGYPVIDRLRGFGPDGGALHEEDLPWMLMYVGWNATNYPGSYGGWTLADILDHEPIRRRLARMRRPEQRRALLANCFHETVRMWPIASLVRAITKDLVIEAGSGRWRIPAGSVLGVLPWARNRDPEHFEAPDTWNPRRYETMTEFPSLFGRGPFSCVASQFNRTLFSTALEAILTRCEIEPVTPPPDRQCRVHLLYGKEAYPVRVGASHEASGRGAAGGKRRRTDMTPAPAVRVMEGSAVPDAAPAAAGARRAVG